MRRAWPAILAAVLLMSGVALGQDPRVWKKLADDGVHDPSSPAISLLQNPGEALKPLPLDTAGNLVRWVKALEQGYINPRTNVFPETRVTVLDQDVYLNINGGLPIVRFPHKQHTEWLDCANCHEHLFKSKAGANRISMLRILEGEQCGVCHGAVAFPLTECTRCHSVPHETFDHKARRPLSEAGR